MSLSHWSGKEEFKTLCNIIAKDRLICLTGAGISNRLKRKSDQSKTLPSWWELLKELLGEFTPTDPRDRADVELLLIRNTAPGEWLIQAATILRQTAILRDGNALQFDDRLQKAVEVVDPAVDLDGSTSDTHRAIGELSPRGIMTFNYDHGHENARAPEESGAWIDFTARDEAKMIELMRTDFARRFLLKAHGSLGSDNRLVLDFETYRELLSKSPTYRSFVGDLLTNFNLLIVGFGMSDPDFDEFARLISVELGGPVRQHVLIAKGAGETPERVLLRRRYGIQTLGIGEWTEIPALLRDALAVPGTEAREIIDECVSPTTEKRREAHRKLQHLSVPGRRVVSKSLRKKLQAAVDDSNVRDASEIIYSLGKLGPDDANKALLFELLEPRNHREVIAHAALALDGKLDRDDTAKLERLLERHTPVTTPEDRDFPDPDNRIPIYLAYLIAQNRRRFAGTYPSDPLEPMPFEVQVTKRTGPPGGPP